MHPQQYILQVDILRIPMLKYRLQGCQEKILYDKVVCLPSNVNLHPTCLGEFETDALDLDHQDQIALLTPTVFEKKMFFFQTSFRSSNLEL